jgi:hypothetical protein
VGVDYLYAYLVLPGYGLQYVGYYLRAAAVLTIAGLLAIGEPKIEILNAAIEVRGARPGGLILRVQRSTDLLSCQCSRLHPGTFSVSDSA